MRIEIVSSMAKLSDLNTEAVPMLTIQAVFENGVFKPNVPVSLASGSTVDLIVPEPEDDPVAIMKARYPNSFGGLSDEDAEEMRKIIEEECERIDPNDWK